MNTLNSVGRVILEPGPRRGDMTALTDFASIVGADGWARLSSPIRSRFAHTNGPRTYVGEMDLRCSALGRLIATAIRAFASPLLPVNESACPASVRVYPERDGTVWERELTTLAGKKVVRSIKRAGCPGSLTEATDGGIAMRLHVFEEKGALVFESRYYTLKIGSLTFRVPAILSPGRCRVVHEDVGLGRFRFTLTMTHPIWGETFYQSGIFADPTENSPCK